LKILVIGNGGRENALIWKIKQSELCEEIYCTIGSGGIDSIAVPVQIKPNDIISLVEFVKGNSIDFTVVGPEVPLSLGIVDEFNKQGLKIFGPAKLAAMLESSKAFAKDFMLRYKIPTAQYKSFTSAQKNDAIDYLKNHKYPLVIKADGLAAGKGVMICDNIENAVSAVNDCFESKIFSTAGDKIVVEDFLTGEEASVFVVADGENYVVLPPAQDHKKILDGEKGKNTGGMGSFAPAYNIVNDSILKKVRERIIEPVLKNMKFENNPFKGCLYCGLMIDENNDPYVIEFNVRFGDPETQVVLPLIKSDFLQLLVSSYEGKINNYKLETEDAYYCCVVLSSMGYPDKYESGKIIDGLQNILDDNSLIFHAGTKLNPDKSIVSSGGRVLNVVGKAKTNLKDAIAKAYEIVNKLSFENIYYRNDIGQKGLHSIIKKN
jgi:phosphoribosylamine---glycine ligase